VGCAVGVEPKATIAYGYGDCDRKMRICEIEWQARVGERAVAWGLREIFSARARPISIELLQNVDCCGEKSSVNVMKVVALAADVIEVAGAAITSNPAKANILPFLDFSFMGRPSQYENCARSA
jgi:hypothetical protein